MIRISPLLLLLLASFTPLFASAGTLINDSFDTTDILFDAGGVETITGDGTFSTTPIEGCPVNYAVPATFSDTSVDVLEPSHPFGPAVNFFGGATASSAIETQLNTVTGETYSVFFSLKQIGNFSDHKIVVTAAGATSGQVGPGNHGFDFVASASTTTLNFSGVICSAGVCNASSDIALDGLTVTTEGEVTDCGGIEDTDADGVADTEDMCPASEGALVDATGCSIAQYCGCDDFNNHGGYISCTARTAEEFLQIQLITQSEKRKIVRTAAKSQCGKPAKKNKHSHKNKHSNKHSDKNKHSGKNKYGYKNSHKNKHSDKNKHSHKHGHKHSDKC